MPRATRRIAAVLLPICCVAPLGAFAYPRGGPLRSLRRIRVVQYPMGVRESLVPIENAARRRTQYQIVKELCRRLSLLTPRHFRTCQIGKWAILAARRTAWQTTQVLVSERGRFY
jgi:hypothetical protein